MSLDDRMRQAYGRQLDDVRRRVDPIERPAIPELRRPSGPRAGARVLAVAAALAVIGAGVAVMVGLVQDRGAPIATEPAADRSVTDEPGPSATELVISVETTVSTETTGTVENGVATQATEPMSDDRPTTNGADEGPLELAAGVANEGCPSGLRAELELATTAYVGAAQGWNRKDDLVDEQDGPFYFQAWEPGYDGPVEVEIVLDRPVMAVEIRVAQDPYTPVAGAITVTIDGRSTPIELDGVGGWRVLPLVEPTVLDRLTVRRDQAEANIVELVICVNP